MQCPAAVVQSSCVCLSLLASDPTDSPARSRCGVSRLMLLCLSQANVGCCSTSGLNERPFQLLAAAFHSSAAGLHAYGHPTAQVA